jgi:hypothetical protein
MAHLPGQEESDHSTGFHPQGKRATAGLEKCGAVPVDAASSTVK